MLLREEEIHSVLASAVTSAGLHIGALLTPQGAVLSQIGTDRSAVVPIAGSNVSSVSVMPEDRFSVTPHLQVRIWGLFAAALWQEYPQGTEWAGVDVGASTPHRLVVARAGSLLVLAVSNAKSPTAAWGHISTVALELGRAIGKSIGDFRIIE